MTRTLTLYPAIDLKGGQCVRLRQGEMEDATVYADEPAAQARAWIDAGCRWLHVVDLDGAFAGRSVNGDAVTAVLRAAGEAGVPVQLGGGIRDMAAIESWLSHGVARILLGSAALKNPALVREACTAFPGRIAAGIDARDGFVATEGWVERSTVSAPDLARRMEDAGVAALVLTEISRDGMLGGLDLDGIVHVAGEVGIPVIASGGVGSLDHLEALVAAAEDCPSIEGVIVGRALYDGRIALREAIDLLAAAP
jgi:phosphoribosylformimino-5-aminoimidazole carboxamide ribotide isomerase